MLKYPQFSRLAREVLSAAGGYAEGSRASLSLFFIRYQQENKHTMADNKPKIGVKITGRRGLCKLHGDGISIPKSEKR